MTGKGANPMTTDPTPTFWAWAESKDSERWQGPFATKAEAIAHGHDNASIYGINDELTSYGYVCEAGYQDPGAFVDMDWQLEQMNEQDEVSWSDEGIFEAKPGAEEALRAWAREYVSVENWCITGEPEEVPPPEPIR